MRYRPGAHRSFRPRHRHWLRGLLLAMLVLAAMSVTTGSFAKAADARDAAQANHVAAEDVVWEMK